MANLIVKSNIREELDEMNVSSDLYDALDEEVERIIERAAERAEENGRKTVRPEDV